MTAAAPLLSDINRLLNSFEERSGVSDAVVTLKQAVSVAQLRCTLGRST